VIRLRDKGRRYEIQNVWCVVHTNFMIKQKMSVLKSYFLVWKWQHLEFFVRHEGEKNWGKSVGLMMLIENYKSSAKFEFLLIF
jgi:hypothetical protein